MKKRMIAIVYKDLGLGGVQKKIVDLCSNLSARPDVTVCLFLATRRGEFLRQIPSRVRIIDLHVSLRVPFVFLLPINLFFAFRRYKPDVVLAMMDTFGCSAICANLVSGSSGPPVIVVGQEVFPTGFLQYRPWFRLRSSLIRILYPHASAIIVVSDAIRRDLVDNFSVPERKIRLIRNWVKPGTDFRQRQKLKKDIDVLYCGRFAPEKNLSMLLESFSLLLRRQPLSTLYLLGYGKEEKNIRRRVVRLGIQSRVFFPGFSYDVPQYLSRAHMVVFTSLTGEGIPLAILEAMAAHVPVITTPFPGANEIVVQGVTGFVAKNKFELSRFMEQVLTNQLIARRVTQNAQKLRAKTYSSNNLNQYIRFLKHCTMTTRKKA